MERNCFEQEQKMNLIVLVRYQLRSDRCIQNPTICQSIDWNADCSREVNQCLCKGFFYPYENQCGKYS